MSVQTPTTEAQSVYEPLPNVGDVYEDTLFEQRVGVKFVDEPTQRSPCVLLCSFEKGGNVAIPHEKWLNLVDDRFVERTVE